MRVEDLDDHVLVEGDDNLRRRVVNLGADGPGDVRSQERHREPDVAIGQGDIRVDRPANLSSGAIDVGISDNRDRGHHRKNRQRPIQGGDAVEHQHRAEGLLQLLTGLGILGDHLAIDHFDRALERRIGDCGDSPGDQLVVHCVVVDGGRQGDDDRVGKAPEP